MVYMNVLHSHFSFNYLNKMRAADFIAFNFFRGEFVNISKRCAFLWVCSFVITLLRSNVFQVRIGTFRRFQSSAEERVRFSHSICLAIYLAISLALSLDLTIETYNENMSRGIQNEWMLDKYARLSAWTLSQLDISKCNGRLRAD